MKANNVRLIVEQQRDALPELSGDALGLLFNNAYTHYGWQERAVTDAVLEKMVSLAETGPTAFNQQPMRVSFVRSAEAKAKLAPALSAGNLDKTMAAPVTAIISFDLDFWQNLPETFPGFDAKAFFEGNPDGARDSATRNGTLQAGYLIMAARALGLDCGPMSGFDPAKVKEAFLQGRNWEVNFLLNLGYGDAGMVRPRNPRLGFGRIAEML